MFRVLCETWELGGVALRSALRDVGREEFRVPVCPSFALLLAALGGDVIPMRRAREGSYEKPRTITGARRTDDPV